MEPPTKKTRTGDDSGAPPPPPPAAAPEAGSPVHAAAWSGELWQSGNELGPMFQFLIQNFQEDVQACLSHCYDDHDSVGTTDHKAILMSLPGRLQVRPPDEDKKRIIARTIRERSNEPVTIAFNSDFVEAFEAYLGSLGLFVLDEAAIARHNLQDDETVVPEDLRIIQPSPQRLRYEARYALDAKVRKDLFNEEPEFEINDAKILGVTPESIDRKFSPLHVQFEYLCEDPQDPEDQTFADLEREAPLSKDEILLHMDYFASGKLNEPCAAGRPEGWGNPPHDDDDGEDDDETKDEEEGKEEDGKGGDGGDDACCGGGGLGGSPGGGSGDGGLGGGLGGASPGGGNSPTQWQRSIQQILPNAVASARMTKRNTMIDPSQTKTSREDIIDSLTETPPNGVDYLETVPPPSRMRRKHATSEQDLRPIYDKRYKDEKGVHLVHKCNFNVQLCDSKRGARTAFASGEDVCATVTVCNPTSRDILVGMNPKGWTDDKSFFGRNTGVRVEIDHLTKVGITRHHSPTALNLKAGKSYTFFRTLINGDHEKVGCYCTDDAYRHHLPLKKGMYTAHLWVEDKKTQETFSFEYGVKKE